jgi:hypothetical protein
MRRSSKTKRSKQDAHLNLSILFQTWMSQETVEPKEAQEMAKFFVHISQLIRKHY